MNLTPSLIVDLSVLGFLLLFTIIGAIKGIFKSVINLVVTAASIYLAFLGAPYVSPVISKLVYPKVAPSVVSFLTNKIGYNFSTFSDEQIYQMIMPILSKVMNFVVLIIFAILLMIILGIVATMIDKGIGKVKALDRTNRILGAVLGFITSFAICFLLVFGITKLGMYNLVGQKIEGSIAYKALGALVPNSDVSMVVKLPVFGDVKIEDITNNVINKINENKNENNNDGKFNIDEILKNFSEDQKKIFQNAWDLFEKNTDSNGSTLEETIKNMQKYVEEFNNKDNSLFKNFKDFDMKEINNILNNMIKKQ